MPEKEVNQCDPLRVGGMIAKYDVAGVEIAKDNCAGTRGKKVEEICWEVVWWRDV